MFTGFGFSVLGRFADHLLAGIRFFITDDLVLYTTNTGFLLVVRAAPAEIAPALESIRFPGRDRLIRKPVAA